MYILYLAAWFPSRVYPHHGNFVFKHIRLVAAAYEHWVLTIQDDPRMAAGTYELLPQTVEGLRIVQVLYGQPAGLAAWRKIGSRLQAYRKGLRYIQQAQQGKKPDLIHAHILLDAGMLGALLACFWRIPLLVSAHCSVYHQNNALPGLRGLLGRWAVRQAHVVLPVSADLGRVMQGKNGLKGHYQVLSNTVDETLFHYKAPPTGEVVRLLHVSNFHEPAKNVRGLIRAYLAAAKQSKRPWHLHLAGDGDLAAMAAYLQQIGVGEDQISLSGPHEEAGIARLLQQHHLFLLFSNYENQPVVLLEAQCCGRPCLATRVGGIEDIIPSPAYGRLVEAGNEAAFTQALLDLEEALPQIDTQHISQRAHKLYGSQSVKKALQTYYEQALAARR